MWLLAGDFLETRLSKKVSSAGIWTRVKKSGIVFGTFGWHPNTGWRSWVLGMMGRDPYPFRIYRVVWYGCIVWMSPPLLGEARANIPGTDLRK